MNDYLSQVVDDLITVQRKNLNLCLFLCIILMGIGLTASVLLFWFPNTRQLSELIKIGPTFITGVISWLQGKDFLVSRERLGSFKAIRAQIKRADLTEEERQEIRHILLDAIPGALRR